MVLRSYIAGRWVAGRGPTVEDVNPARPGEIVATYQLADDAQVASAIEAAVSAFRPWARTPTHDRAAVLAAAADLLEVRCTEYGAELTREQGKTIGEGVAEVKRAAEILRYNAGVAQQPAGEVYCSPRSGERILTLRAPVGPVAIVTPWNVPIAIPAWKLGPALVHGNTVVWKPARIVPLLAVRLMEVLEEAGLPSGVCNLVLAGSQAVAGIVSDDRIKACSFTGSTVVGKQLVALGAQAGTKVQAEMGGKNAAIVLADADLDYAVGQIVSGAMFSTGQRCTATSRALIDRSVYEHVLEHLTEMTRALRTGDPLDPTTQIGPLASADQRDQVLSYYRVAAKEGAQAVVGGASYDNGDGGYFVEPTVLVDVEPHHRVFMEEVFGPVLAVVPFDDVESALALANRGPYGLAGAVFTRDLDRALQMLDEFDVGVLHINSETCGADPHVPFGGVKDSGTSDREMGSAARDFYTQYRTIYVREATPHSP